MRLSNKTIDREKNKCYEKDKGKIQTIIIEARGESNKERLLMALNLILTEKDVVDYFKLGINSSNNHAQKSIQNKEKGNSLLT